MTRSNQHNKLAENCSVIEDLIPEYAFGLTAHEETLLVEANLASCPDAAAQLADFQRLQEDMRGSVPQLEPPPGLEARLMAAIAKPAPAPAEPPIAIAPPAPRRRKVQWAWVAAAAAALVLVVSNIYWITRVNTLSQQKDQLAAAIQNPQNNAFMLTSTDTLRWARLPGSEANTANASAFLMWNGESQIGLLYVRGFEDMAPGDTYTLVLTRGDEKVDAGTFSVDEKGIGTLLFHITSPIDQYTWAHISDQSTGEVVANGQLQST